METTRALTPGELDPAEARTRPSWRRDFWRAPSRRMTVRALLMVGLPGVGLFMLLTALNVGGQVVLWENAHWTLAGVLATSLAAAGAGDSRGTERRIRGLIAVGAGFWLVGQLSWDLQTAQGFFSVPAPSDLGFLGLVLPIFLALILAVHRRMPRAEELAAYLDSAAIFLAISAAILAAYGAQLASLGLVVAAVTVAYPILHLATAAAGLVALLATRATLRLEGGYLLLVGFAVLGFAWVAWLADALVALPPTGSLTNYAFSIGIIVVGLGGAGWRLDDVRPSVSQRGARIVHGVLPLVTLLGSAMLIVLDHVGSVPSGLVDMAAFGVIVVAGIRQAMMVHERGRLLDDSGRARRELEDALDQRADADSRYRMLVERVPATVYIDVADPDVSDGGHLAYMSPQVESILGYPPSAFVADPELWPSLIHPDDRQATLAAYSEHWASARPLRADFRMIARSGEIIWVHDEAYSMVGTDGRRVSQGLLVDTTEQKRLEEQLLHDALHDPLTGLANRVLFRDHVERAMAGRSRRRTKVAILFLDLDDFKVINDSLGHRAGDRLLSEVAARLSGAIRAGDIAARQGGDEFTVLLDRVRSADEAEASAERIANELRRPIELEGRSIVITVSIGIALSGHADTDADDLLAHADAAMYDAKARGKSRHATFDPSMRLRARSRLEMEADLRAAIEQETFEVHYQPIIALATNRVVGLEALVRWRHPTQGLVSPGAFIPLAEETGLIIPLGRLVTAAACRTLRRLLAAGAPADLTMSVNVSPRQAIEPTFAAEIAAILEDSQLAPSSLILEITETLMLHESAATDGSLRRLNDLGVQLVVDDFGTGFSALEYFKRFSIQGLKLDRSFVSGLGDSREDTAIVTATLAFASALDLTVTAEGVETSRQLDQLRALGCQLAQGYLFARPLTEASLPGLLSEAATRALVSGGWAA